MSARIRSFAAPAHGRTHRSAPTGRRGGSRNHPGQRRTAKRLRRGWEEWGENQSRDYPKSVQQRRTIPQSAFGRQLPLHKGALGAGGTDCHVGPAGLLAMTMVFCHSEERADVGIRPFYDGREFGPPRSSAPTENPINHPSQPARSEASAPAAARDGRESTQGPSQKGDRPRNRPGSA